MIVMWDEWSGVHSKESSLRDATWADIARLIQRLDARKHTIVTVSADEDNYLMVGGGNGKFVVTVTQGGDRFFDLIRSEPINVSIVRMNVGGQEGEYPADQVVDENAAVACAMTYLKGGKLDERFTWRES